MEEKPEAYESVVKLENKPKLQKAQKRFNQKVFISTVKRYYIPKASFQQNITRRIKKTKKIFTCFCKQVKKKENLEIFIPYLMTTKFESIFANEVDRKVKAEQVQVLVLEVEYFFRFSVMIFEYVWSNYRKKYA